jgi:hypothetical protein
LPQIFIEKAADAHALVLVNVAAFMRKDLTAKMLAAENDPVAIIGESN